MGHLILYSDTFAISFFILFRKITNLVQVVITQDWFFKSCKLFFCSTFCRKCMYKQVPLQVKAVDFHHQIVATRIQLPDLQQHLRLHG